MFKKRFNLRKVIATAICLAGLSVGNVLAQNVDVYAAGYEKNAEGKSIVKVWKNGNELHSLATVDEWDGDNSINGIFVVGSDVYVVGQIYGKNKNGDNKYLGKVWKNDAELYSFDNGLGGSYAKGIYVSGGDVYVVGYEKVTAAWNSINTAWVRKNGGILYSLTNNNNDPDVSAMYVSGNDIYVSGRAKDSFGRYKGTVWKNGSQLFTFGPTSAPGTLWSNTYDIAVSGNVVYVSGYSGTSSDHVICTYNGSVNMAFSGAAYSLDVFDNKLYSVIGGKTVRDNVVTWDSYENAWISDISVKNQGRYVCGSESKVAKVWRNGEELYALTDGTNAATASSIFVVERGNTGINDVQTNSISLYPNPVKDELLVQSETHIDKFEIYDIMGKQILNGSLSNSKSINVSALSAGIYVLKIGNYRGKFVKE